MARIALPAGPGEERDRMWSLRPEFAAAADTFSNAIQENSILPVTVHEAARIRIAHINGCEPCSDARIANMRELGLDDSFYEDVDDPARRHRYSEQERLAIEFAERFATGIHTFDEAFWQRLNAAFTNAELVDLAASCAKWLGLGRINAVFGLTVSCPIKIAPSRKARPAAHAKPATAA